MKSTTHLKKEISIAAVSRKRGDSFPGTSEFQPTAFPIFTLDIKSQILFQGSHFSTGGGGQREDWAGLIESAEEPGKHADPPRKVSLTNLSPRSGWTRERPPCLEVPSHQVLMRTPAENLTPDAMGPVKMHDSPVLLTHVNCT